MRILRFFFFDRQRASVFLACLQSGFELVMWPRLSFNSWSFCLSIPNDGIILVHHHAHPEWAFLKTNLQKTKGTLDPDEKLLYCGLKVTPKYIKLYSSLFLVGE